MCGSPHESRRAGGLAAALRWGLATTTFAAAIALATAVTGDPATPAAAQSTNRGAQARLGPVTRLHYAANDNVDAGGVYVPGGYGFNLADVSTIDQLTALPAHVRGLVYLGLCNGADASFVDAVSPFVGNPKVYGFYLIDEPDPTGRYAPLCPASSLRAEADWIHAHVPGAKTFIVLMDMGTPAHPDYAHTYTSSNTNIDLFGLDPYPCRVELHGCDYAVIGASVRAAAAAGIPSRQVVPVYQAFGGGGYANHMLPTVAQERTILATWARLTPAPPFDYAYSWGRQKDDHALVDTPALREVLKAHNAPGRQRR